MCQTMLCFFPLENILDLAQWSHQMDCKNMKSIAFSNLTPMAMAINSSFSGKVTAPKIMNGLQDAYLKIVKSSIVGTNLAVTGQALHDTFCPGFNFSPRFNGQTTHLFFG